MVLRIIIMYQDIASMQDFKAFNLELLQTQSSLQNPSRKSTSLCEVARPASQVHSFLTIFFVILLFFKIIIVIRAPDWLTRNRDNLSEWSNISTHKLLFHWASTKIVGLIRGWLKKILFEQLAREISIDMKGGISPPQETGN